jgi:small subunit ribosomal protein S3
MGQKIRPTGFRTGIMVDWQSSWYAAKADFSDLLLEDAKIRKYIKKKFARSGVSKIRIERTREKVVVHIHSAKVGVIIGKKGAEIEKLTKQLEDLTHRKMEIKTYEVNRRRPTRRSSRRTSPSSSKSGRASGGRSSRRSSGRWRTGPRA